MDYQTITNNDTNIYCLDFKWIIKLLPIIKQMLFGFLSLPPSLSALVCYQIWSGQQDKATLTPLDSHKATPGLEIAKT